MNKRGSPLILSLFVVVVLAGLSAVFLYKQINQSFLVNRYADSTRAFWIAEAGLQDVISTNLVAGSSGPFPLGGGNYACVIDNGTSETVVINSTSTRVTTYYPVHSTGTFGGVERPINALVKQIVDSTKVPAGNFQYGVQSTVGIEFKGSSTVAGETSPDPLPAKYRDPDYYKEDSAFSFLDLFGYSSTDVKAMCEESSNFYNNTWPSSGSIAGVTWVKATSSTYSGNDYGSGILIIEGDLRVTGTINFDGIIYVMGELFMAGTATINGSILAESNTTVDDDTEITGTANILHNSTIIENALEYLKQDTYFDPEVVSWQED